MTLAGYAHCSTPCGNGSEKRFTELVGILPFKFAHPVQRSGDGFDSTFRGVTTLDGRHFRHHIEPPPLRSGDRCKITAGNVQAERRPGNRSHGRVDKRLAGDGANLPGPDEGETRVQSIRLAPKGKIAQLSESLQKEGKTPLSPKGNH